MNIKSDSDAAYFELLIDSVTQELDVGPLLYSAGAWVDSYEIYINGLLQNMVGQYSTTQHRIVFIEPLQPGDTVKVIAKEERL